MIYNGFCDRIVIEYEDYMKRVLLLLLVVPSFVFASSLDCEKMEIIN